MPVVRLRDPLKRLAGGRGEHRVEGGTVIEALRGLERAEPAIAGWVLDERGRIRRHINVFVDGERCGADARLDDEQRIEIIPAISGGG